MNHRLLAATTVGLAVIGLSGSVDAQAQETSQPGDNEFSVEAQGSTYKYEEPGVMELKGVKGGIAGRVTHRAEAQVFVAGEARFAYGKVDYTSVESGSASGEPDYLYEYRGLVGKRFGGSGASASPYFGLGWRHLVNDGSGTFTSAGGNTYYGYLRVSDYYYLPLGVDWRYQFDGGTYVEANGEYELLLRGTQKSYLEGETIKNIQSKGYGFRASVLFGIGPWAFGPFVNRWKIDDSTVEFCEAHFPNGCVEPKNNTVEAGLRIRYSFQ